MYSAVFSYRYSEYQLRARMSRWMYRWSIVPGGPFGLGSRWAARGYGPFESPADATTLNRLNQVSMAATKNEHRDSNGYRILPGWRVGHLMEE